MKKILIGLLTALSVTALTMTVVGCEDLTDSQVKAKFTVSFSVSEGTAPESQTIEDGGKVTDPGDSKKTATAEEVFSFAGWFAANAETAWVFDTDTVSADVVLTAKFTSEARKYTVTVTIDGEANGDYSVAYGQSLKKKDLHDLPERLGYYLLLNESGVEYNFDDVVTEDCTLALTSKWVYEGKVLSYDEGINGIVGNWRFDAEAETHDGKLCAITYTTDEKHGNEVGCVKIDAVWCDDDSHKNSAAEITLGNVDLTAYDSVYFYIKTTAPTSLWFGNYYDQHRFDITYTDMWLKVLIERKDDGSVDVTVGAEKINYPATAEYGDSKDWINLNTWNLEIIDKNDSFAETRGQKYSIYLSAAYATLDYTTCADKLIKKLPASADEITHENAKGYSDIIVQYNAIADKYFTDGEKAAIPVLISELDTACEEKLNDHLYFAEKMAETLPEYASVTEENKSTVLNNLITYCNYVDVAFTAEEKNAYVQPEKIAFLLKYFEGAYYNVEVNKTTATTSAYNVKTASPESWYLGLESKFVFGYTNQFEMNGTAKQFISLPALNYSLFGKVQFGIQSAFADGVTHSVAVYDTAITDTVTSLLFIVENGKLRVDAWNGATIIENVALPDDVVKGKEGLKITIDMNGYGWFKVTELKAEMKSGNTEVYTVTFKDVDGKVISTSYYLAGGTLVVPEDSKLSYSTETADYVFVSWDKELLTAVNEDAVYIANQTKTEHLDFVAQQYADALISVGNITADNEQSAYDALIAYLEFIQKNNITASFGTFTMPDVSELKEKFSEDREIYVFTNENKNSIADATVALDDSEFTSRTWILVNHGATSSAHGVTIGKEIKDVFNITLPKINYSLYKSVNIAVVFGGNQSGIKINGTDVNAVNLELIISVEDGKLVVRVYGINSSDLIATVIIDDHDMIYGKKSLTFSVINTDWNYIIMTDIHGTLKQ